MATLKVRILKECHDAPTAGHFGQAKTMEVVSRNYYFPKMRSYIENYVNTCDLCNRNKPVRHKPFGLLQSIEPPTTPWESIAMDFIVKLPPLKDSSNQAIFDSIWVVVDRFTKYGYFIPCNEAMDAELFARLFVKHVFAAHGLPKDVITDRGTIFVSSFIQTLCNITKINHKKSTSFHPQTDGQTERLNQVLEQYLRMYCNYEQDNWVDLLPLAQFPYNNAEQASTNTTPFFANYGYHPRLQCEIDTSAQESPAAGETIAHLQQLHKQLRTEIVHAQSLQQKYANLARSDPPSIGIGTYVWLLRKHITTKRPSQKLDHRRLGPYKVIRSIKGRAYELELPASMRIFPVFHVSLLEPVTNSTSPGPREAQPPKVEIDGSDEWEVEEVIASKKSRNQLQYLVHWKGFGIQDRTWEPVANLQHCRELVEAFHKRNPSAPRQNNE